MKDAAVTLAIASGPEGIVFGLVLRLFGQGLGRCYRAGGELDGVGDVVGVFLRRGGVAQGRGNGEEEGEEEGGGDVHICGGGG